MRIIIKLCIFKLVYSWVPNRRGVGKNGGGGDWINENLMAGVGGGRFIWYVKIEYKEAELFWVTNDWQNTPSSSVKRMVEKECSGWKEINQLISGGRLLGTQE